MVIGVGMVEWDKFLYGLVLGLIAAGGWWLYHNASTDPKILGSSLLVWFIALLFYWALLHSCEDSVRDKLPYVIVLSLLLGLGLGLYLNATTIQLVGYWLGVFAIFMLGALARVCTEGY